MRGAVKLLKLGPNVKNFKIGDHVVIHWMKNLHLIDSKPPTFNYRNSNKKINAGWVTTFSEYGHIIQ